MAVEDVQNTATDRPLMRDYWSKFRRRTYIVITAIQCIFMIALFGSLEFAGVVHLGLPMLFTITFVAAAIINAITITCIHLLGRPFRDLVQAVVLIAGEPSAAKPPNPNTYENDKDGFKEILQTVYELGTTGDKAGAGATATGQESLLVEALANTTSGVVVLNPQKRIVYHSLRAPVRVGPDGSPNLDVVFPEDNTFEDWIEKVENNKLLSEHIWTRVANKVDGERGRRIFDISASYHKNSPAETVLIFFDRSNDYAPEEDDFDFISFAAHELRGPITVIRGYLDVLRDELKDKAEKDQIELLERLVVTSNRLTSYVNNILNASRYDRRHLKLHLSEETIRHMYDQIADDMNMRASAQNRLLIADIPDTLPTVAADGNAVGEVMGNLIDNAIKYSNEGGLVHLTARAIPGFVEISIIDRGIGMPSNVLPNLFHKFYRSHRSRETVAGTGIGLYICKAIVSSHGGTIDVRSVENEGSTFSFTLPIYDTVADKLKASHNSNQSLIEHGSGWIRNHSMYRGR